MKRFLLTLCLTLAAFPAWGQVAIYQTEAPAQSVYARIRLAADSSLHVAATEGTGQGVGFYHVTDAAIASALTAQSKTMAAGNYPYKTFLGTPSATADDQWIGQGIVKWGGTAAVDPLPFTTPGAANGVALVGSLMGLTDDGITAAKIAPDAIGASELAASAIGASEIATDALSADEVSAAAVTEIQSGLSTQGFMDDMQDDVTAILADTTVIGAPAGASISADIAAIESQTDDIGVAGAGLTAIEVSATLTDVDQEPVPTSRVFELVPTDDEGLIVEKAKVIVVGADPNTYAVDFKVDMPTNGRIATVSAPTISSGTAGGITFANLGRDKSQAKFRPTAVTAGSYEVRVEVTYTSGASAVGTVLFTVVE